MDEGQAALWGGVVSGALVGLKADLLSGGLTLGGGLIAGGLLGALGSAGLARCVNLVRGTESSWLSWNAEALDAIVEAALLRYLAVAHFGRGRGDWAEGESPAHWKEEVAAALAPQRETLAQPLERPAAARRRRRRRRPRRPAGWRCGSSSSRSCAKRRARPCRGSIPRPRTRRSGSRPIAPAERAQ